MNKLIPIALCIFISVASFAQSTPKVKWKKLHTEEEVRVELNNYISIGSTENDVESFLKSQKLERFGKIENYYFAYAKTKSYSFWIAKEWMMKFYLEEDGTLFKIDVESALTGP